MITIFPLINKNLHHSYISVTVDCKATGGKRSYRKVDYCVYCEKAIFSKISTHYINVHRDEDDVNELMMLNLGSKERKQALVLQYFE